MTDERLTDLIAAYGADPNAWPENERAAGRAALARRPQAALAEDVALDAFLASASAINPPPGLVTRLMPPVAVAQPSLWTRLHNMLLPNGRAWPAGIGLACLCIGMVTGYVTPTQEAQTEAPEAFLLTAFQSEPLFDQLLEETQ